MSDVITSRTNPTVLNAAAVGRDRPTGLCLVEGPALVAEAASAGWEFEQLFSVEPISETPTAQLPIQPTLVSPEVLQKIGTTVTPQSPIGVVRIQPSQLHITQPLLVLWELSDPGNVGTLIRTAAAMGFQVMLAGGADAWSTKALRSGSGGHFKTPLVQVSLEDGFSALSEWQPVAAVVESGAPAESVGALDRPAIVIGNEAHGLPDAVVGSCGPVTIDMVGGTESLNAAQSGAILMWEWKRQARERDQG
jgi:TrmH family RNA methyltransferase